LIDLEQLSRDGFAMKPSLLSAIEVDQLIALIEEHLQHQATVQVIKRGGVRDVMERVPALRAVADHPRLREIVNSVLGSDAIVVRSTLFDKTPGANWKVPWHQDVTIAVRERIDAEGYGPWSVKEGIVHVQPPTLVLDRMLTIRVHLDPCPATNGALRVMPGTHKLGRINQNDAPGFVDEAMAVTCIARAGAGLIMRPLLLHASSASALPGHRRVLHFDFANVGLTCGLNWQNKSRP
jgi:ectoine hydroxylase-related dioxygenase (phytanoyl-CoA dioxygenase family)